MKYKWIIRVSWGEVKFEVDKIFTYGTSLIKIFTYGTSFINSFLWVIYWCLFFSHTLKEKGKFIYLILFYRVVFSGSYLIKSLSHVRLFWDAMNCSPPGSSVHGIVQARILEWVAIPFFGESSQSKDWTWVSHIAGRSFTVWTTREVHHSSLQQALLMILFSSETLNKLIAILGYYYYYY